VLVLLTLLTLLILLTLLTLPRRPLTARYTYFYYVLTGTSSLKKKSKGAQCRKKYCDHCLTKFYRDVVSSHF
jgi:hypothetical protein